jgi:protein O-GlcNAc transferase
VAAERAWQLALAHYQAGRLDDSEQQCKAVLEAAPTHADALHLLGVVAHLRSDCHEAARRIEQALELEPSRADFLNTLGLVYLALGDLDEAETRLRAALELQPAYAIARGNLGIVLRDAGRLEDAEAAFREALRLDVNLADAHNNLGNLLKETGRTQEAERSLRRAIELRPGYAEAHANLGIVMRALGRLQEAEQCARRAIALKQDFAEAHNDLGVALFGLGRLEEAERSYRQALSLDPALLVAQGNLVYLMNCLSGRSLEEIYFEHREFAQLISPPDEPAPHANAPDPRRRLRIGYVSADFRQHSVAFFIEPVLAQHDRECVEVFCYYNLGRADEVTERLRRLAQHWRDVRGMDEEALAKCVREDGIDILVDLGGFTANNRLPLFARKPAPVQVTWLGYLNTTGLDAMDYRISDAQANPPGPLDRVHSERIVRMPDSQWCYLPPADAPEVGPAPFVKAGKITFASFSIPAKLDGTAVAAWGELLGRVPGSRLIVATNGLSDVPAQFTERLVQQGIPRERLRVVGSQPFDAYLAMHNEVDIVLDSFPFTGGTTSCHALWMGVPVVSLAGETSTSRGGASLLHAVGLEVLLARNAREYVDIAAALAGDTARLAALRAGLRERMRASALMDAPRFTRNLEAAYRDMWRTWCAHRPAGFLSRLVGQFLGKGHPA